jgi:hypothetical protein
MEAPEGLTPITATAPDSKATIVHEFIYSEHLPAAHGEPAQNRPPAEQAPAPIRDATPKQVEKLL